MAAPVQLAHLIGAEEARRVDAVSGDEEVAAQAHGLERRGNYGERGDAAVVEGQQRPARVDVGLAAHETDAVRKPRLERAQVRLERARRELVNVRVGAGEPAVALAARCDDIVI